MKIRVSAEAKGEGAGEKAAEALKAGRKIFTLDLTPTFPLELAIEAVEEHGWRLEHVSAYWNTAGVNNRHVLLVFRAA